MGTEQRQTKDKDRKEQIDMVRIDEGEEIFRRVTSMFLELWTDIQTWLTGMRRREPGLVARVKKQEMSQTNLRGKHGDSCTLSA